MHPILTMRTWAHDHHVSTRHEMAAMYSQWIHGDKFWPVFGLVLAFGFMILLMYLAVRFGPTTFSTVPYTTPYFFWMH
jgi:hypothetical protein